MVDTRKYVIGQHVLQDLLRTQINSMLERRSVKVNYPVIETPLVK